MLVSARYADPVMDMEPFTLTYADVRTLMRDLKTIGARNATRGRAPGLTGKSALEAVTRNYETLRHDGRLPATFEVVYGHAWKPLPRVSATGRRVIDINVKE
jgi:malonyl-CoA O-methyltransferase